MKPNKSNIKNIFRKEQKVKENLIKYMYIQLLIYQIAKTKETTKREKDIIEPLAKLLDLVDKELLFTVVAEVAEAVNVELVILACLELVFTFEEDGKTVKVELLKVSVEVVKTKEVLTDGPADAVTDPPET